MLACVHTERYLNHPSPVQCYNRTMMVTGRACWFTQKEMSNDWHTSPPITHHSRVSANWAAPLITTIRLRRRFYEKKRNKKGKGEGKSSETKPKAHLSVGWGGLDRAEIKPLWEHSDHNLRNPQALQLSLTGPETPTSHTHPRSAACEHIHKRSQTNNHKPLGLRTLRFTYVCLHILRGINTNTYLSKYSNLQLRYDRN